jgi:hypothetical protein
MPLWSKLLWDKGAKVISDGYQRPQKARPGPNRMIPPVISLVAYKSRAREGGACIFVFQTLW